jgi:hypothetical protein
VGRALLFPSVLGTGMIGGMRKILDAAASRVGWQPGEIRTRRFRHTYCAARVLTAKRILRRDPATGKSKVRWVPVSRTKCPEKSDTVVRRWWPACTGTWASTSIEPSAPNTTSSSTPRSWPRLKLIRSAA